MTDPRFTKLARLLIEYSTRLQRGEKVLIEVIDVPDEMGVELMRAARAVGGTPIIEVRHSRITREIVRGTDAQHAGTVRDIELARMKKMQAYIAIRGAGLGHTNRDSNADEYAEHNRDSYVDGNRDADVHTRGARRRTRRSGSR